MQSNERIGCNFMLYLIDEYSKQYPHRRILELQRFEKAELPLHEMTIEEVNNECANWESVSNETAANTKRKIAQYLNWLADQGCTVKFNAADIVLPIKEEIVPQIYSTSDIHKHYEILKEAVEKAAAKNGGNASMFFLNMTHAAGILAFYGLTDNEILSLDLSDIRTNEVVGYNLPLTQDDIEVLLSYKYQTKCENNLSLQGGKYIRNASTKSDVTVAFINRPLSLLEIDEQYQYLKTILRTSYLSLCGKFNRAYHMEKTTGQKIVDNGLTPQWFLDIFKVSKNMIVRRRKEYIAYRNQREKNESEMPDDPSTPMPPKAAILNKISVVSKAIEKLTAESHEKINKLSQEVEELQAQLQKYM